MRRAPELPPQVLVGLLDVGAMTTCPTCGPICGLLEFTPADMLETPIVVGPPETWEEADE